MSLSLLKKDSYRLKIDYNDAVKIKSYPPGKWFKTDVFRLHNLNWYARIAPGGYNNSNTFAGNVAIYVYLIKMPIDISKMLCQYRLKFPKLDIEICGTTIFTGS